MSSSLASQRAARHAERYTLGTAAWLKTQAQDATRTASQIRIPEFVLFAMMIFEDGYLGIPVPFNQLAIILMLVLALFRRPPVRLGGAVQVFIPIMVLAVLAVGMVSLFADPTDAVASWERRLLRMAVTMAFIFVVASGRIELRSGLAGIGTGLLVNAVLFYAGLAPDRYGGVLSGFLIDKNVAGMGYTIYGLCAIFVSDKKWVRLLLYAVFGVCVVLTGSRTSISAYLAAGIWIVLAPRLPLLGRWLLGGAIAWGIFTAAEDFSQIGQFSEREGSDILRARIDAASQIKVQEAGFFGEGLGQAYVWIAGRTWFFHNSYWTALVEGGWPWLIMVVGLTVIVGLRPFTRALTAWEIGAQAVSIALLICAWRLGEVFFTPEWGFAMAYCMRAYAVGTNEALASRGDLPVQNIMGEEWQKMPRREGIQRAR